MNQPKNIALTALALVFLVTPGFSADAAAKKAGPVTEVAAPEEEAPASEAAAVVNTSAEPEAVAPDVIEKEVAVPVEEHAAAPAESGHHMPELDWSFDGPFGTYDKAALQRGFQVYKQVCSSCHALKKLYYRNLTGLGYSDAQIKTIAAEYTVTDGPNDEGDMFERPARPSDHIKQPYENDKAAAYANNGAIPPDLSLITKARHGGANYVYGVLTGYAEAPAGVTLTATQHYNKVKDGGLIGPDGKHIPGGILAMAPPLSDGLIAYEDKSPQTTEQYARDVAQFLTWAAEPEMEARKVMGAKVTLFLAIFALLMYAVKRKVWEKLH